MVILTGANTEIEKNSKGFSFKGVIRETVGKAEKLGYIPVVYDLGELGMGEMFHVTDDSFVTKGYYEKEVIKGYKSKSLFKPEMVKECMRVYDDIIAYLDGDALLYDSIDEIAEDNYDVGVTLRDVSEIESEWHQKYLDIVKYVNAGVIFFKPTYEAKRFVDIWQRTTEEVGNDQMALNKLTCPDYYPEAGKIVIINSFRIKYFPCKQYNYYYFNEGLATDIKIMHFKGDVRHFYPFDWKKRLYCKTIVPVLNKIKPVIKGFICPP